MHNVYYKSPKLMLMLLVVKLVGKNWPTNVMLSPPIILRYWFGNSLDKVHGIVIRLIDWEFGIKPKLDFKVGINDPQVAFYFK